MKEIILVLMAMPSVAYVESLVANDEYVGEKATAVNRLMSESLRSLSARETSDIRSAVEEIDNAIRAESGGSSDIYLQSRMQISSFMVRGKTEAPDKFKARISSTILDLSQKVAVMNRAIFDCEKVERVFPGYKVFHPWNVISTRKGGGTTISRMFPLKLNGNIWSFDPSMNSFGGTSGGYDPLAEFDYYAEHFKRRSYIGLKADVRVGRGSSSRTARD